MEGISERYGERRDGNIATDMAHVRSGRQKRRGTDIINGRHSSLGVKVVKHNVRIHMGKSATLLPRARQQTTTSRGGSDHFLAVRKYLTFIKAGRIVLRTPFAGLGREKESDLPT